MHTRIEQLAEKYGESIDNLPIDVLMEAIYYDNAPTTSVLHDNKSEQTKKEED